MKASKQSKQPVQQAKGPDVKIRTSNLFDVTAAEKSRAYPGLGQKILDFYKSKTENKLAPFGSSDKAFSAAGNFSGLKHAHLNADISVVYSMHGSNPTVIDLYGVFSHDELGTGQPSNLNRQKSTAKRFKNMTFN